MVSSRVPEILIIDRYTSDSYFKDFRGKRVCHSNLAEDYTKIFSSHRPTVVDSMCEGRRLLDNIVYDAVIVHVKMDGSKDLASEYSSPVVYLTDEKREDEAKTLIENGGAAYIYKKVGSAFDKTYFEYLNQVIDKLLYSSSKDNKRVLIAGEDEALLEEKVNNYRRDGFDVTSVNHPYKLLEMLRYDLISKAVIEEGKSFNRLVNILQLVYSNLSLTLYNSDYENPLGSRTKDLKGKLIGITGPSGSGKTSLLYGLLNALPNVVRIPKDHSRAIRKDEVNGIDFNFIGATNILKNKELMGDYFTFMRKGNLVGVNGAAIREALDNGKNVVLTVPELDLLDWLNLNFSDMSLFNIMPSKEEIEYFGSRHSNIKQMIRGDFPRESTSYEELQEYLSLDAIILENPHFTDKMKREFHLLSLLSKVQKEVFKKKI